MNAKLLEDMIRDTGKGDDEVLIAIKEFTHWPPDPKKGWQPTDEEAQDIERLANLANCLRPKMMDRYLREIKAASPHCGGNCRCH